MGSLHYLYRHYDAGGSLLYVGVTMHPKSRLAAHKNSSSWGSNIAHVKLSEYVGWDGRQKALDDEAYAIAFECPKHNRTFMKARAANVARIRVVSDVRLGSRAKKAPIVQYIDGVKYIRADAMAKAIGVKPADICPDLDA